MRVRLARKLRDAEWVNRDLSLRPRAGADVLEHYYSQIAAHRFVLSPPGRGVGCYRTWEALYLGAVPVVVNSAPMAAFRDLPILFTDDYEELSESYLTERWREISARSFELDRLLRSWYFKRFMQTVRSLDDPRFVFLAGDSDVATRAEAWLGSGRSAMDVPTA